MTTRLAFTFAKRPALVTCGDGPIADIRALGNKDIFSLADLLGVEP